MPTYDRPVEASLHVHLANGETWEVTPNDLANFRLTDKFDAYSGWEKKVTHAINDDITESPLNPLRYLLECILFYPDHFTEYPDQMQVTLDQIRDIHRFLVDNGYENAYPDGDE